MTMTFTNVELSMDHWVFVVIKQWLRRHVPLHLLACVADDDLVDEVGRSDDPDPVRGLLGQVLAQEEDVGEQEHVNVDLNEKRYKYTNLLSLYIYR